MSAVYLTTFDNPYDPSKDFINWFMFDIQKGYYTCAYLARVAHTSDQLTPQENTMELEKAIDQIVKYDPFNLYTKVRAS